MFGFVEGDLIRKSQREVIIQTGQVGWNIFVSKETLRQLPPEGNRVKLWTSFYFRLQDGIAELYGFLTEEEKEFFELLNSVAKVGPKSALAILGLASLETLKAAIASGNAELLTKVSGVGRKTAERVVMELKSKIKDIGKVPWQTLEIDLEVIEALLKLGYSKDEARKALDKIPQDLTSLEDRVKEALKILGSK